jgi:8-amino-7-oxononanoate synthase
VVGTLGKALGAYGGYACCDRSAARLLLARAGPLLHATAPPPPAVAGGLAALELLRAAPERVDRLARNARVMRDVLRAEGLDPAPSCTHVVGLEAEDAAAARRAADLALERGVLVEAVGPGAGTPGSAGLRLAVMSNHTRRELRAAAGVLAAALAAARPAPRAGRVFDALAEAA